MATKIGTGNIISNLENNKPYSRFWFSTMLILLGKFIIRIATKLTTNEAKKKGIYLSKPISANRLAIELYLSDESALKPNKFGNNILFMEDGANGLLTLYSLLHKNIEETIYDIYAKISNNRLIFKYLIFWKNIIAVNGVNNITQYELKFTKIKKLVNTNSGIYITNLFSSFLSLADFI